jgi:TatD DNase family protein
MAKSRDRGFPGNPDPLPLAVADSHTHLDLTIADRGPEAPDARALRGVADAVERAAAVGVDRIVQIGIDLPSSQWGIAIATDHPAVVATVALHPNEAPRIDNLDNALREVEALAEHDRVRGIGETGLDYFRTGDNGRQAQHESFRAHIEIAKRYGKALVIHDREAHDDVLGVLSAVGAPDVVVRHCFSGDEEFALECARRGYVLSFAGNITFASAGALRDAARVTPLDQLMVETDAPFLTPVPHRGRPNASFLVPHIVRLLAEVRGVPVETVCHAVSETANRVFGPWR